MKIHRFYVEDKSNKLGLKTLKILDKNIIHQANTVLHLKKGEYVKLFDGIQACDYLYNIRGIGRKELFLESVEKINMEKINKDKKINVYVSIIKSDFDLAVRQLVEMGVDNIYPIISDRTERKEINMERFHKIVVEASEQCGRYDIPSLSEPEYLGKYIGLLTPTDNTIAYHTEVSQNENKVVVGETNIVKNLNVFIGPEGGWSEREIALFKKTSAVFKRLDTYILKTSTACVLCTYDAIKSFE